jgi:hypothetical protein
MAAIDRLGEKIDELSAAVAKLSVTTIANRRLVSLSELPQASGNIWSRYRALRAIERARAGKKSPLIHGVHYWDTDGKITIDLDNWLAVDWSKY